MLVQEERLLTLYNLPVQLPQTSISAGDWLAIATVQVPSGATLDFRWLQIYIAGMENSDSTNPCGVSGQSVINTDFPAGSLVTAFLIKDWSPAAQPWTQTIVTQVVAPTNFDLASSAQPPIQAITTTPLLVKDAGNYTFVVLNNTTNRSLIVSVSGVVTVDSDPL